MGERTCAEHVILKSSVTKHYGCFASCTTIIIIIIIIIIIGMHNRYSCSWRNFAVKIVCKLNPSFRPAKLEAEFNIVVFHLLP